MSIDRIGMIRRYREESRLTMNDMIFLTIMSLIGRTRDLLHYTIVTRTIPRLICGAGAVGFNVLVNTSKATLTTAYSPSL